MGKLPLPVLTTPIGPIETLEWGDGPTLILLLHAAASGPGGLSGLAKALIRPDRRIVAPALHGYGQTSVVVPGDRMDAHVAVARACLDAYPAERRMVFGHSMGGLVALLADLTVDAIAVHEPIVVGLLRDDDPDDRAARDWDRAIVDRLVRAVAAGDPEAGIRGFVEAWNEMSWPDLPQSVRSRLIAAAPALADDVRCGSSRRIAPDRISPPLLILQGSLSPPITARMTDRLHASIPGSRRVVLPGCGHMAPVQAPAAVTAALGPDGTPDDTALGLSSQTDSRRARPA